MNDFAVIKTGGKQYIVSAGTKVQVEKLESAVGETVSFDQVLLRRKGENLEIGAPVVTGATVSGKVIAQERDEKKLIFKYSSKARHHRTKGHRQHYTEVEITSL